MKTYVHIKSGKRVPALGCITIFSEGNNGKMEVFVRGEGAKKFTRSSFDKKFRFEEIPDLAKPFTDDQFREYAKTYGVECAQEFLECCDYSKPTWARKIINPPTGVPSDVHQAWFQKTFGVTAMSMSCAFSWLYGNHYILDPIRFEKVLTRFGYDMDSNESMNDFIARKFGEGAQKIIREEFLKIAPTEGAATKA